VAVQIREYGVAEDGARGHARVGCCRCRCVARVKPDLGARNKWAKQDRGLGVQVVKGHSRGVFLATGRGGLTHLAGLMVPKRGCSRDPRRISGGPKIRP